MGFIPTNKVVLKKWLADLSANIAEFGSGVALLDAQIDSLERRCVALVHRIEHRRIKERMDKLHRAARIRATSAKRLAHSR